MADDIIGGVHVMRGWEVPNLNETCRPRSPNSASTTYVQSINRHTGLVYLVD